MARRPRLPADRAGHAYAALYCEENVWHLAGEPGLAAGPRHVVFVSGLSGTVAMWAQRAAPPGRPVLWDYHVVLLAGALVFDLDTRLAFPAPLGTWLAASFPCPGQVPPGQEPRFRVVGAADFRATFASDRSHMAAQPGVPGPPWPCIRTAGETMNLHRFTDVGGPGPGEVLDREGLLTRFSPRRE